MSGIRETLKRSRFLRKAVNRARRLLATERKLMRTLAVPEAQFATELRRVLIDLVEIQGRDSIGDYFEFGVFNGISLSSAYRVYRDMGLDHVRFFGFDSFEGLPPEADIDDEGKWLPGMCYCPIEVTRKALDARGVDWNRVFLIKGWFKDTLTPAVIAEHRMVKASVVMVDCDIYSSTVTCLNFIEPLINDRAVMLFDDWNAFGLAEKNLGEKRAFEEWCARHPDIVTRELGKYRNDSMILWLERVERGEPHESILHFGTHRRARPRAEEGRAAISAASPSSR